MLTCLLENNLLRGLDKLVYLRKICWTPGHRIINLLQLHLIGWLKNCAGLARHSAYDGWSDPSWRLWQDDLWGEKNIWEHLAKGNNFATKLYPSTSNAHKVELIALCAWAQHI